jgi:hypothetical protein
MAGRPLALTHSRFEFTFQIHNPKPQRMTGYDLTLHPCSSNIQTPKPVIASPAIQGAT